jgi:hypothetical protein
LIHASGLLAVTDSGQRIKAHRLSSLGMQGRDKSLKIGKMRALFF